MNYNTYPYGIFNPQYLSQFQAQQMEAQRNLEQQKNIYDMVKAISDLCEAARKVDAVNQQAARSVALQKYCVRLLSITEGIAHDHTGNRIQALEPLQCTAG